MKQAFIESLYEVVKEQYPTLHIHAVNVDNDHVHFQIEIPPNIRVSKAVQVLKVNSSKKLRRQFKFIDKMYLEPGIWSVGYFSSTIGINEQTIKKYIEEQGRKDYPSQSKLRIFS